MGVVLPRRSVHEGVERIAIDDEVALARDEKHLPAAAGKVAASELIQPRRRGRCGGRGRVGFRRRGRSVGQAAGTGEREEHEEREASMIMHGLSLVRR